MEVEIHPKVAMIIGDAAGIGPEDRSQILEQRRNPAHLLPAVIGDARLMAEAVRITGVPLKTDFKGRQAAS